MPFVTQGKTNLKYILIVVVLATIVGGGVLGYQYWWVTKKEVPLQEVKAPEKVVKDTGISEYQWACGSLHTHIMIFEDEKQNIKSLEEVINASKKLGFKFIMQSEKGPAYNVDSPGWKNMIKECDKNISKDFVCLSGQENCSKGHFVIIESKNYIPETLDAPEVFEEAHKQGSIIIVAHPFYKEDISDIYNYSRWDILDWEAMEVLNGVIDQESNEKALKKIYELWNKGIKKSLTGGADFKNHKAYTDILLDPEEVEDNLKTGYTCLYLKELNKGNIINAIKDGRGYASSGPQINEFSINNAMIGQIVSAKKGDSLLIKIDVKAGLKIKAIQINNNSNILKKFNPATTEFATDLSIFAEKPGWYNLEIYSEDGRAFTNAIWLEIKK